jgi:lysozyme
MSYVFYPSTPMQISKQGIAELAAREGIGLTKYLDSVGVQTIGIGATVSDIKDLKEWSWEKTITIEEAFDLYIKHLQKYVDAVNKALKVPIEQYQFDAIVSVTYNIGTGGMAKSTFMKLINAKTPANFVANAIKMWNKPPEIRKRRASEAEMYVNGTYPNKGKVLVFAVSTKTHHPIYSKGYEIDAMKYI